MGFLFTLLFVTTAYITPAVIWGPLAPYHIEVWLGVLAVLFSIPAMQKSRLLRRPQTYAVAGLCFAVVASYIGNGYFGGAPPALYGFLISAAAFFLPAINCHNRRHMQWIVLSMFLCSAFYIARGSYDLYHHVIPSLYVFGAETLPRLRGLGVVNDPNDLAQVLVSLIPCIFLWKSRKSWLLNILLVWIPCAVLVTGMYLTHSRGSAIALMVVCAVAARKKIGTVPAAVVAGLLLVGVLALGWSGGRDVSMEAGADRMDAWSVGLELIKAHPFVGVGAGRFADFNYITAHNSVIVCAAEIGIPGLIFWVLFIFSTYRLGLHLYRSQEIAALAGNPAVAKEIPSAADFWKQKTEIPAQINEAPTPETTTPPKTLWKLEPEREEAIAPDELQRIARLLLISLTGFLAAGWFLSRAYALWLFLYVGLLCATVRIAAKNGVPIKSDSIAFLLRWSLIISVALLAFVYVLLRFRNLTEG